MLRFSIPIVFLALLAASATADRLIVTREGDGIWATRVRRDGSNIVYTDRDTGEEKAIAEKLLEAVIPTVQRGKDYKTEAINKYIGRIQKAKRKHGRLKRPLNALLSDWNALLKPAEDLSGEIQALVAEFIDGDKSLAAYNNTNMELGMLGYKDKRDQFARDIKEAQARTRDAYLSTARDRLFALAKTEPLTLEVFARMKSIDAGLRGVATEAEIAEVDAVIEKVRLGALHGNYRKHQGLLKAKGAGLDRHLAAIGALKQMQLELATTEKESQTLLRLEEQISKRIPGAFSGFRFDAKGYPFHASDVAMRRQMSGGSRRVKFQNIDLDEQCFVIPRNRIPAISLSAKTRIPLRLIFNQVREGRAYGLRVTMFGEGGMQEYTRQLAAIRLRDGHVDIDIDEDFKFLPAGFSPSAGAGGGIPTVYFYIVSRAASAPEDDWQAISLALGWPLSQ